MLGIIGGTGIYSIGNFGEREIETPYGIAKIYIGEIEDEKCIFIPRHGIDHQYPPHKIPYKANVWALKEVGVDMVLATYACGIISKYKPGDLILAEDVIGLFIPHLSFFDDFREGIKHRDFSFPFDEKLKKLMKEAAKNIGIKLKENAVVATTPGPRYESKAEIKALKKLGANLVSMTNAYEVHLLNELEIKSVAICIGTNWAAGIKKEKITHQEVSEMMKRKEKEINNLIVSFVNQIKKKPKEL